MFRTPSLLKTFRTIHLYLGIFLTPALLFFAFSGALQTFGLHETNRDHPNYKPAHWIAVMAQIHKKQVTAVPVRRPLGAGSNASTLPGAAVNAAGKRTEAGSRDAAVLGVPPQRPASAHAVHPLPLRLFFLLVCFGLVMSTLTGLTMSYAYMRNKVLVAGLLVAGAVTPILLVLF